MSDRRFHGDPARLRSPERTALLEVDRVVTISVDGLATGTVLDVGTGTAVFAEARRVARRRVVVFEWPYVSEEHGPPLDHRLKPEAIEALLREQGLDRFERTTLRHMHLYRIEI